jgi:putative ABC transport system permease protein
MRLQSFRHASLRHAVRRLARARGFTAAAVLTLMLGIGATTAVFCIVYAVLLRPLPYSSPERLVSLSHTLVAGALLRADQSDASILFYQRHSRAFTHIGGYQVAAAGLAAAEGADAERVPAGRVTSGLFGALRVSPLRGRLFTASDDQPGAAPVAVIGERLWNRKYGRDPGMLNRRVDVDGVPHDVVGIVPAGVRFPSSDTELWLPMRLDPAKTESATFDYQAIARLRDGISIDAAAADLQRLLPHLPEEFPGRMTRGSIEQTHMRASVRPLAAVIVGDIGRVLWVVMAAAGFVLAIACANVANLFLVRAEARRKSIAVQCALGAATGDILVEFLSEGFLVASLGGLLGLGAAAAGVRALPLLGEAIDIPRLAEVNLDAAAIAVAGLSTLFAALLVSGLPALRAGAASVASVLASTGHSMTASRERHRVRQVLVASQVALALILLVGSGLMARSVWRIRSVPTGFNSANTTSLRMALPSATYSGSAEAVRFFDRAVDGLAAIPGVQAAGAVSKLPLDEQGRTDSAVFVEDRPMAPGSLPGIHPVSYATPGYFGAAGIPFITGRSFRRVDPAQVVLEAIVSRAFAERYWHDEPAIGKRLRIITNGPWYTVVGVVGNVRDTALDKPADQMVYCPLLPPAEDRRWAPRDLALVVRTAGAAGDATRTIRDVIRGLDSSLPVYRIRPLADIVALASARRLFTLLVIGFASGAALLLGAIGLYGVMSYVVTLRTHEMGIRLALGAQPREVRRMVSRQGLTVAMCGIAVGLAGAVAMTRFLAALLFEVSPMDPAVLALAAGFLLTVAALASWLPARRAAAVDPALALRAD